jgi:hypothetical protein
VIGLKRYIRPGLVVSVGGHLAALIVGLFFVGANAFHAPPPEAMVVEVVTPDELPRFEGTPSARHSSGSETPSPSVGKGAVTQAPPPAPRPQPQPQPQQQAQQRPTPQREAKEAAAQNLPVPKAAQAELVGAEKTEPEKQNPSEAQPATEPPQQAPEQPNFAEAVAQYVALGGPLGGGFAAPPVDTNVSGYDWTAPFRERVGSCSKKPEGVESGDKVTIKIRISFNHDGTVASPPRLLVPAPSAKQQALMDSAVDALERCQPFTMLPPEKYKQWKTMQVYVTPLFAHW